MAEPNPNPEFIDPTTQAKYRIVPKFTKTFIVDDLEYTYGYFISSVQKEVKKSCTEHKGIFQPVLPQEKKVPEFWFHIELKTKSSSITLAIRMDNLYLVGFKTPAGMWWEFGKNGDTHLLDGNPSWLGFGGGYPDLIGGKGPETVTMSRAETIGAVNYLAKKKKTMTLEEEEQLLQGADQAAAEPEADPNKSSLVKLVIMVCEGLRFVSVSRRIDEGFDNQPGVTLTEIQGKQVQKWDRISKAIYKWAENPEAKIDEMIKLHIKDKNEAEKIVALVKYQTKDENEAEEIVALVKDQN